MAKWGMAVFGSLAAYGAGLLAMLSSSAHPAGEGPRKRANVRSVTLLPS